MNPMIRVAVCSAMTLVISMSASGQLPELTRRAAFGTGAERDKAFAELARAKWSPEQFEAATRALRRGRDYADVDADSETIEVAIGDGPDDKLTVLVSLPSPYDPKSAKSLFLPGVTARTLPTIRTSWTRCAAASRFSRMRSSASAPPVPPC